MFSNVNIRLLPFIDFIRLEINQNSNYPHHHSSLSYPFNKSCSNALNNKAYSSIAKMNFVLIDSDVLLSAL